AHFGVGAVGQGPIDDADPVVRLGVLRLQFNVLLVITLRLLEQLGIVRSAAHLEQNRANAIDGAEVLGINLENVLELSNGLLALADIFLGRGAGNVLAGVSGGEIDARIQKAGIKLLGLLEILDGLVVQSALICLDTFVEKIACLELIATAGGDRAGKDQCK